MPISTIGYDITLLDKPLVIWLGILTFLFLFAQVAIAFLSVRLGKSWAPFGAHRIMGYLALLCAGVHAVLVGLAWW